MSRTYSIPSVNLKESDPMQLFFPKPGDRLTEELVWRWYCNIPIELENHVFDKAQHDHFYEYYSEGGVLRPWRRPYFRHHLARTFTAAISFLMEHAGESHTIIDLGCGVGTQSLALAMLGARVVAMDMDAVALDTLRTRKAFYERHAHRLLDIQICETDAFEFDYASVGPIDGLYSLFAFNMMQPSSILVDHITPHLSPHARIVILDGNNRSWMPRLLPWRRRSVWSPEQANQEFVQRGFRIVLHEGGAVLPPLLWPFLSYQAGATLDRMLRRGWFLPISHLILAERGV